MGKVTVAPPKEFGLCFLMENGIKKEKANEDGHEDEDEDENEEENGDVTIDIPGEKKCAMVMMLNLIA